MEVKIKEQKNKSKYENLKFKIISLIFFNILLLNIFLIKTVFAGDITQDKQEILLRIKELGRENFEENLRSTFPDFFETGLFYEQGYNYFLFENTCGQSIGASALNILFNTNFYSENMLVDQSINNSLCDVAVIYENQRGSQTASQLRTNLIQISNKNKNYINCDILYLNNFLTIEEMDDFLNSGVIILNISSDIFWFDKDGKVDHFILLKEAIKDNKGNIKGFEVIDSSGSQITFIDIERLNNSIYGYEDNRFKNNEMILISRKILKYKKFDNKFYTNLILRRVNKSLVVNYYLKPTKQTFISYN